MNITINLSDKDIKEIRAFNERREALGYIKRAWSVTDRVWVKVADAVGVKG